MAFSLGGGAIVMGGAAAAAAAAESSAPSPWGSDSDEGTPQSMPDALDVTDYEDDSSDHEDDFGYHTELVSALRPDDDPDLTEEEKDRQAKRSFLWGVTASASLFIGSQLVGAALAGGTVVDEDDVVALAALSAKGGTTGSVTGGASTSAATAASTSQYVCPIAVGVTRDRESDRSILSNFSLALSSYLPSPTERQPSCKRWRSARRRTPPGLSRRGVRRRGPPPPRPRAG